MKKIAIPTSGNTIDDHFGHCQYYTIYTLGEDDAISSKEIMPSPGGCGCKSDIASVLKNMGVTTMIAGNMGEGALNKLNSAGLEVFRGFHGDTDSALNSFLEGEKGEDITCTNHGHGHNHGEGHSCNNHS